MLYLLAVKRILQTIIRREFVLTDYINFCEKNLPNNLSTYPIPLTRQRNERNIGDKIWKINFLNACRNTWKFGAAVSSAHD